MARRTIACWLVRHADALPAMPHRDEASVDVYDNNAITVNKSNRMFGRSCMNCHSEHSRVEPSVRPVLHAIALGGPDAHSLISIPARLLRSRSRHRLRATALAVSRRRQPPTSASRGGSASGACRPPAAAPDDTAQPASNRPGVSSRFGGRLTNVEGRSGAVAALPGSRRNGALFTDARYEREDAGGGTGCIRLTADNVGLSRSTVFRRSYERTGRFVTHPACGIRIPQFYSVDTKTPYTMHRQPVAPRTMRRSARSRAARRNCRRYVPIAPQFDLIGAAQHRCREPAGDTDAATST